MTRTLITLFSLYCLLGGPTQAHAQDDDGWRWTIAPYLWTSDVKLDLTVRDRSAGGSVAFGDLVDKLDTAFMGHVEARRGRLGLFGDAIYIDLSDSKSQSVGPGGPILGDVRADASLKLEIYEAGAAWDVSGGGDVRIDLLAGIRSIEADVNAVITLPGPLETELPIRTGPSETDVMLGMRLVGFFAERWNWGLRSDYSFGGTEGVFNTLAVVGYRFGERETFSIQGGYRFMSLNLEGSTPRGEMTEANIELSGPVLGLLFRF